MKRLVLARIVWLALFFGVVGAVCWVVSIARKESVAEPQRATDGNPGNSRKQREASQKPETEDSRSKPGEKVLGAAVEIEPKLERQDPKAKEPVDLDAFGDITDDVFRGVPNQRMILADALVSGRRDGKSDDEIVKNVMDFQARHQAEWIHKNQDYDRKKIQQMRERPENKGKSDEQLNKELLNHYAVISDGVITARLMRAQRASFRVAGVVMDEQDRPVSDVDVNIRKESSYQWGWGNEWTERFVGKLRVNGAFAWRVDDARDLNLEFCKPGYYNVKPWFRAPEIAVDPLSPEILGNKKVPPRVVAKRDLRIVMEKQGKLTHLASGGCTLTFFRDGHGSVLTITQMANGNWLMQDSGIVGIKPPKHLPENCVYMTSVTDAEGGIVKMVVFSPPPPTPAQLRAFRDQGEKQRWVEMRRVYAPEEIRLKASDRQAGFIRYEPKPGHEIRPDRPWSRDMKEAPPEGYAHELVLDREAIKKLFADPKQAQPVYFYIKAFGKYGKGQLYGVRVSEEPSRDRGKEKREACLRAEIQVLMQTDGSGNLEGYE